MNALWILPVLALTVLVYLAGRHRHDASCDTRGRIACTVVRAAAAFHAFNADNIEIYERYLRTQRPWEAGKLRWVRSSDGWRLEGEILPPSARR